MRALGVRKTHLLRFGAFLVLLTAVLPNVTYVGHWSAPDAGAVAHTHVENSHGEQPDSSADDHAQHCHTSPAGCSGPSAIAGSIWVGEDAGLLNLDAAPHTERVGMDYHALNTFGSKILQPPRPLV
jgi:hypothetical protein